MTINGRNKGASGEREAAKWLADLLSLNAPPKRNLEQVRSGGWDLHVKPFLIEVKRVENLNKRNAWIQIVTANRTFFGGNKIPIVLYRKNRKKWKLLISAKYVGLNKGFVQLDTPEAERWLKKVYSNF